MEKPKSGTNPFYVLLVIVGMVFVIHVFAYSLMTYQTTQPTTATAGLHTDHPLWRLLDSYHAICLVLCAVLTTLAPRANSGMRPASANPTHHPA